MENHDDDGADDGGAADDGADDDVNNEGGQELVDEKAQTRNAGQGKRANIVNSFSC